MQDSLPPFWRDYTQCLKKLAGQGIPATKFNYSNDRSRHVILRCSPDGQTLIFSDLADRKNLIYKALGLRVKKRSLSDFTGVIYGGATSTFERYKVALMTKLEKQQEALNKNMPPKFEYIEAQAEESKQNKFLKLQEKADNLEEFHPWECISLVSRNGHTLDLVIKDEGHMMAVLNVLVRSIYAQQDSKFLKVFMRLKFKAKLSYECWRKQITLRQFLLQAIIKSVQEMALISIQKLKDLLIHEDGVPEFSQQSDSQGKMLIEEDKKVEDIECVIDKHHERAEQQPVGHIVSALTQHWALLEVGEINENNLHEALRNDGRYGRATSTKKAAQVLAAAIIDFKRTWTQNFQIEQFK